jgi:uncharacterized membrane protein (Fun14 family)
MAKRVHATLGAQMGVGARLEIVIVMVTWLAWAILARTTVVKLAWWALATLAATMTLRAIATACVAIGIAWWAVTQGLAAFTIAWRSIAHAITADMAIRAWGSAAFSTLAATATASGLVVADALHHFAACGFGRCRHDVAAWGLA